MSRSSCIFGVSAVCTAFKRWTRSSWSCLVGSGGASPSAVRMSRSARSPIFSEIRAGDQRLDARQQLVDARQRLATRAAILLLRLLVASREARLGVAVACGDLRIDRQVGAQIGPLTPRDPQPPPGRREILIGGRRVRLLRELGQPAAPPFGLLRAEPLFFFLAPATFGGLFFFELSGGHFGFGALALGGLRTLGGEPGVVDFSSVGHGWCLHLNRLGGERGGTG